MDRARRHSQRRMPLGTSASPRSASEASFDLNQNPDSSPVAAHAVHAVHAVHAASTTSASASAGTPQTAPQGRRSSKVIQPQQSFTFTSPGLSRSPNLRKRSRTMDNYTHEDEDGPKKGGHSLRKRARVDYTFEHIDDEVVVPNSTSSARGKKRRSEVNWDSEDFYTADSKRRGASLGGDTPSTRRRNPSRKSVEAKAYREQLEEDDNDVQDTIKVGVSFSDLDDSEVLATPHSKGSSPHTESKTDAVVADPAGLDATPSRPQVETPTKSSNQSQPAKAVSEPDIHSSIEDFEPNSAVQPLNEAEFKKAPLTTEPLQKPHTPSPQPSSYTNNINTTPTANQSKTDGSIMPLEEPTTNGESAYIHDAPMNSSPAVIKKELLDEEPARSSPEPKKADPLENGDESQLNAVPNSTEEASGTAIATATTAASTAAIAAIAAATTEAISDETQPMEAPKDSHQADTSKSELPTDSIKLATPTKDQDSSDTQTLNQDAANSATPTELETANNDVGPTKTSSTPPAVDQCPTEPTLEAPTSEAHTLEVPTPKEPTPEAPTPKVPTPEAPTLKAPTPDALTPDALTPDAPTPEAPTIEAEQPLVDNSPVDTKATTPSPDPEGMPEMRAPSIASQNSSPQKSVIFEPVADKWQPTPVGRWAHLTPYIEDAYVSYPEKRSRFDEDGGLDDDKDGERDPNDIEPMVDDNEDNGEVVPTPALNTPTRGSPALDSGDLTTFNSPAPPAEEADEADVSESQELPMRQRCYKYRKLRDAEEYISSIENFEDMSTSELYDVLDAINVSMVQWQTEWNDLGKTVDDYENSLRRRAADTKYEARTRNLHQHGLNYEEPEFAVKGYKVKEREGMNETRYLQGQDRIMAATYGFEYDPHPSKIGKQNPETQQVGIMTRGRSLRNQPRQTAKATETEEVTGKRQRKPVQLYDPATQDTISRSSTPAPATRGRRRKNGNGDEDIQLSLSTSFNTEPASDGETSQPKTRRRRGGPRGKAAIPSIVEEFAPEEDESVKDEPIKPTRRGRGKPPVKYEEPLPQDDLDEEEESPPVLKQPRRHLLTLKIPKGKNISAPSSAITDNGDSRPSTADSESSSHTAESLYSFPPKRQKRFRDDPDENEEVAQGPPRKRGKRASGASAIAPTIEEPMPSVADWPEPPSSQNNRKVQKIKVVRSVPESRTGTPASQAPTEEGDNPQKDYKSMTKSEKMSASMKNRWANGNMAGAVEKRKATLAAKKAAQAAAEQKLGALAPKPKGKAAKKEAAQQQQQQQQIQQQQIQQQAQLHVRPSHPMHHQQLPPPPGMPAQPPHHSHAHQQLPPPPPHGHPHHPHHHPHHYHDHQGHQGGNPNFIPGMHGMGYPYSHM